MADLQTYLDAATRPNTRRSYAAAVRHFEVDWGGCLPASAETIARYLAHYADQLSANTLAQRLAGLARWHGEHGFADPTRAAIVKQALRGIRTLHPRAEKRATPLQLLQLGQAADWLETAISHARARGREAAALRHSRDRALILLGFWRGFRSDELIGLRAEHVRFIDNGLECFVGRSKADRAARGTTHRMPALTRWCPVAALRQWLDDSGITEGPVFRKISAQGKLGSGALHANSVIPVLRNALAHAGLDAEIYSSHSLRRGFANWANANGWDLKSLMEYVGWRDIHSAMRYVDGGSPFALPASETPAAPQLAAPSRAPRLKWELELEMSLVPIHSGARGRTQALRIIEKSYLSVFRAQRLDTRGTWFSLTFQGQEPRDLEDQVATLIDDIHRIASNHNSAAETFLREPGTGREWR